MGAVNATDADEGPNSELIYTFDSFYVGQSSHFIVDKTSGAIRVASADIDRESQAFYKAKIKVLFGVFSACLCNLFVNVKQLK